MHLAQTVDTPVLGLHAASNPARSGPYLDRRAGASTATMMPLASSCINRTEQLKWGRKIEYPGVMALITVDDVMARFQAFTQHAGLG